MPSKKHLTIFAAAFSVISGSLALATPSFAANPEKVLYSFCTSKHCPDGAGSVAGLILDANGNLYGTTEYGGTGSGCKASGCGTVFELIPDNGKWTEKVLYSFCRTSGCPDGWFPRAGLISDSGGNLYGTTFYGGTNDQQCYPTGCGTVFELTPHNGKWTERVLYRFCADSSCLDGGSPSGGVILDTAGNLYGTTTFGGTYFYGTVFELTPHNGKWTEKVLHNFNDDGKDGFYPVGGVIRDKAGHLYGATQTGGTHSCGGSVTCGTVFELIPNSGAWTEKVLHSFNKNGTDGYSPEAGLILDARGNLYGTTEGGGAGCGAGLGCGTVFELTPNKGRWTEKVLHSFFGVTNDGTFPEAAPILDAAGNLYGTTNSGGAYGVGIVFELAPANGRWTEKVLHTFKRNGKDGAVPWAGLARDKAGHLYGTTGGGGVSNDGTVFEVMP